MEIALQQSELIAICAFTFACAFAFSFGLLSVLFRRSKIRILSMRKELDDLEAKSFALTKSIAEIEKDKAIIGKNIENLKNQESLAINSVCRLKTEYDEINIKTKELQSLATKSEEFQKNISRWENVKIEAERDSAKLHEIQSKIDLYSRIDDFVDYGLYERPEYLFDTSEMFFIEIKRVRDDQKKLIKNDTVIICHDEKSYAIDISFIKKITDRQKKMIIRAFNIECDYLISKVNPGNFDRTIKQIENIANSLEKDMADLRYGFNNNYIKLKMEECKLQYQYTLRKKEEIEEQRAIREQIREEEKARREYERELAVAQNDENTFQEMLAKAKEEFEKASDKERQAAQLRIEQLEMQLSEAISRAERAKSMAEQTRKGHVYIISNIGSFGEHIYKIGLTRRLDPAERVKELGDASVPFSFDVHAMIASDDAPALERELHVAFNDRRVNAVNMRKEFFHVPLEKIRSKTQEITGRDDNFTMTILAEEYFQTRRLKAND